MAGFITALLSLIARQFADAFGRAVEDLVSGWERDRRVASETRAQVEREHAVQALEIERDLVAIAARRDTEDDVLARLQEGSG